MNRDIYTPDYSGNALHGGDPAAIKDLLRFAGQTQSDLAREIGVTRSMIHQVIDGVSRSDFVEKAIAEAAGTTVFAIFPAWYQAHE
ncbi:MAG: helix-turn-helix domain-containing protein [Gammaproteobacteria bacterium]